MKPEDLQFLIQQQDALLETLTRLDAYVQNNMSHAQGDPASIIDRNRRLRETTAKIKAGENVLLNVYKQARALYLNSHEVGKFFQSSPERKENLDRLTPHQKHILKLYDESMSAFALTPQDPLGALEKKRDDKISEIQRRGGSGSEIELVREQYILVKAFVHSRVIKEHGTFLEAEAADKAAEAQHVAQHPAPVDLNKRQTEVEPIATAPQPQPTASITTAPHPQPAAPITTAPQPQPTSSQAKPHSTKTSTGTTGSTPQTNQPQQQPAATHQQAAVTNHLDSTLVDDVIKTIQTQRAHRPRMVQFLARIGLKLRQTKGDLTQRFTQFLTRHKTNMTEAELKDYLERFKIAQQYLEQKRSQYVGKGSRTNIIDNAMQYIQAADKDPSALLPGYQSQKNKLKDPRARHGFGKEEKRENDVKGVIQHFKKNQAP